MPPSVVSQTWPNSAAAKPTEGLANATSCTVAPGRLASLVQVLDGRPAGVIEAARGDKPTGRTAPVSTDRPTMGIRALTYRVVTVAFGPAALAHSVVLSNIAA